VVLLLKMEVLMNIDLLKLENCKNYGNKIIARCPACKELDKDKNGNHLIIYSDGRFGCIIYPKKDGVEHRKRIFQLIGKKEPIKMTIDIKEVSQPSQEGNSIKIKDVLGHLGRAFSSRSKTILGDSNKLDDLVQLYLLIIEKQKSVYQEDKQSSYYESQKNVIDQLEKSFSYQWNKLDEFMQKNLFEVLCKKDLIHDIVKKTVDVFNARVIALV